MHPGQFVFYDNQKMFKGQIDKNVAELLKKGPKQMLEKKDQKVGPRMGTDLEIQKYR